MGAAALAVYQGAQSAVLWQSADKRQVKQLSCRYKRAGRGIVLSAGKAVC